ncbi:Putative LEA domain protein [Penicillium brasilianum]|uniref:Putative LEA domain protein n=1 Tax=Penicillium brasilianum TaxID=104259 RepID=A0A0F7TLH9_PENBI|nr:Putative LEA domain protein [Penicillium brasilianum]
MSAVAKAPPKVGSKTGSPAKLRKGSGSSAASKPSVSETPAKSVKKTPAKKLTPKAPEPIQDDVDDISVPETPSPKSKKKAPSSEQRRTISPPDDAVSQASGSAAPLGGGASGLKKKAKDAAGKAKDAAGSAKDTASKGAETVTNNVPLDLSALKGLSVADGGQILGDDGNPLGKVVEGDPEDLVGQTVGDDGEIVDEDGDLIGRVDILHDVEEQTNGIPDEAESKLDEAKNVVTDLAQLEGLAVSDGGVIKNSAGQVVGKIVEGDPEDLIGYTLNEDGEVVDDDGDAIGRVELLPVEEQEKNLQEAAGDVTDKANVVNDEVDDDFEDAEDNLPTDQVKDAADDAVDDDAVEEAQDAAPDVDEAKGKAEDTLDEAADKAEEGVDEAGDAVPDVDEAKDTAEGAVEEAEEAGLRIPDLDTLEGLTLNKRGYVIDKDTGKPIGELIEGDPKKISRLKATLDDQGQFWDNRGNVIGKVKALPVEDDNDEEGPFAGLEGLVVGQDGWIEDENQRRVGKLVEGDAKKLIGRGVDEDGEILDRHGSVIGRAEPYEEPEPEPEEEEAAPDLSILDGLRPNKAGYVIGSEGFPIARVVEGDPKKLAGKKIYDGEIYDGKNVVGRVELIPEEEREDKAEGPFAGFESLVVTKDGFVEDEEGTIVGKLIEGDAKKLRGRAVDEDGEITDKYGNVKGRAEPYEEPEEEAPEETDLSILEGKVVNKSGKVVDPATGAVFGRVVEGGKGLAGRKVDGKGQIWGDDGKIIGRAELIPGAEQEKAEGAFYGFDDAVVGKDGLVFSGDKVIGRLIEGDAKRLVGRKVDEDGDVSDKNGNTIGKAERWEPEEKQRDINPMSGRKVNKEGEVRDADGNLIGKLTSGNLATLVGKKIDDNGFVIDNDGNKIGECTLLENIPEEEPEVEEEEGPTAEEQEAQAKAEQDRQLAEKMCHILRQTLDQVKPICKQITDRLDQADRTPKDELDEEKLVKDVKPLIEEGGRILQECNGSIRGLDPDGRIAATAKARASTRDATPEEYQLADMIKELTETVVKTIDNGKRRIADMPHAKKKLNPLWALLSEPLFQIIAAVGLLLNGVLSLVGRLLDGLGLGGILNGILGGLGLDKLINNLGLGGLTDALGLGGKK